MTFPDGQVFLNPGHGGMVEYKNPLQDNDQFHKLTGDPETHAKIFGVLDEWFSRGVIEWYENPAYLTKNGGWRAWWLRAYLQILLDGK